MVRRRHYIHPRERNSSPISTPVASRRDDEDRSSISDDTGATPGISATPYQDNRRRFGDILNNSGLANTPQVHGGGSSQNTDTDTNSIAGPSEKTAADKKSKEKEG